MNYLFASLSTDAYENLARDEYILDTLAPGDTVLYLYVNARAVIIGRNQNPLNECDMHKLNADGVQLVRRISGGGAVYHDAGNLNFSFITSEENYSEARFTGVILSALAAFGINAEATGRNDITVNGLKFSGGAFAVRGGKRLYHGTLLVSSDLSVFSKYLTPSKLKLDSKGIKSVRARVCSLNELAPALTVEKMKHALTAVFSTEFGEVKPLAFTPLDEARIAALRRERMKWEWRMGETPRFDAEIERRFSFGNAKIMLRTESGMIREVRVYTDSMDTDLPEKAAAVLKNTRFDEAEIIDRLESIK
ncbi:MAG: lipoate--protein ligase [Clostridia bacterium]|nr:lipoate--protein ligase [Clostridia bacterium]